ncbi:Ribonuclease-III-like protein [Ceratobasidium theobromae]|uniref:Ribonuclease-III-like protein n=1 Tax=Ceratobasidium theobromae TaxID=1582974 RepID=A0A5N5QD52_9AGAM|nr:Ribonuclease-III-like protein [Ceratobasidium theobromae]
MSNFCFICCRKPADLPRRKLSFAAVSRSLIRHPTQTRSGYYQARAPDWTSRPPILPCSDSDVVDYFRKLLPPLEFPEDVAIRMITHSSWRDGINHNNRQSFIGRRVLHAYLMTFLHAYTPLTPTPPFTQPPSEPKPDLKISELPPPSDALEQDFNEIIEKVVDTRSLGEHVGGAWQIERVMRWVPNVDQHSDVASVTAEEAAVSGLFKIRGTTVQGVVGGVFHQFGGVAAHRLFHTRVLPYVAFILPKEYRKPAEEACKRLGGLTAPILLELQQSQTQLKGVASNVAAASE